MIDQPPAELAEELGVPEETVRAVIEQLRAKMEASQGAEPKEKPRGRWWTFGLRGLLLLTVLVCVFLGGRALRETEVDRLRTKSQQLQADYEATLLEAHEAKLDAVRLKTDMTARMVEQLDMAFEADETPPGELDEYDIY